MNKIEIYCNKISLPTYQCIYYIVLCIIFFHSSIYGSSKDLFSYFKNNSHYFLAYHQDEYNEIFEPGFIICKDFN